jgi:hypothetical protein|mmetsp:Transcript_110039/g.187292  ORF Transcript_110039/g.187292 Transcript_110039/m.187292 type:complete len:82 (+) Transcript_110039:63-308(+)
MVVRSPAVPAAALGAVKLSPFVHLAHHDCPFTGLSFGKKLPPYLTQLFAVCVCGMYIRATLPVPLLGWLPDLQGAGRKPRP